MMFVPQSNLTILCIEGPDSCGKSTQVKMLTETLRYYGLRVLSEEVPFKGMLKNIIYKMLKNGHAKKFPTTFQLIHFLNRKLWQMFVFPFLSKDYDVLILGRWSMSSFIYGSLEGVNKSLLLKLKNALIEPHFTFILNGQQYIREQVNDVYENDITLQRNVVEAYNNVLEENGIYHVNNAGSSRSVNDDIVKILNDSTNLLCP